MLKAWASTLPGVVCWLPTLSFSSLPKQQSLETVAVWETLELGVLQGLIKTQSVSPKSSFSGTRAGWSPRVGHWTSWQGFPPGFCHPASPNELENSWYKFNKADWLSEILGIFMNCSFPIATVRSPKLRQAWKIPNCAARSGCMCSTHSCEPNLLELQI